MEAGSLLTVEAFGNWKFTWKLGIYLETESLLGNLEFTWKLRVYLATRSLLGN